MDSPSTSTSTLLANQRGITLVETLVTIAILAILLGIAVPSFDLLINRNRAQSSGKQLIALLQYARAQAQISHQEISVTPQTAGDWTSTLVVSRQQGGDGPDSQAVELRRSRLDDSAQVQVKTSSSAAQVVFDSNGIAESGPDYPLVFTLDSGSYGSKVCLQRSGAVWACE
ncbi:GspH/FimT family pseudopilin [Pseudomonas nicosulfuronedens]|uniref:Type II secretion system protein H n=1 Tax=Pseudomonas nicosulfuronedens TaxID=2571105 RepID=A0A5R9RBN5_9PSED|nr:MULTISPECIES: GspH/FimT family pseudopilin [Pseudomonas]MDH1007969.1 GspH/FimT family pseudopilin [Pseudomonas nicosulfuronedens]MDH1978329.1 GspH/FimT family pseudopilin [Pseudomonas nicosulfuronedens]MDH2025080.1 GspH/FimT family pseudopilin [Pseudomonas nicosulfuronedens]TLX80682.1 prepilin-type N-terminal cleavage/methylation domain-containing protein [Pseudomonas nicosulfuronedens]